MYVSIREKGKGKDCGMWTVDMKRKGNVEVTRTVQCGTKY